MANFEISKGCEKCGKKNVCKYVENRKEMENTIATSVIPYTISDAPFSVVVSCSQFCSDTRVRTESVRGVR